MTAAPGCSRRTALAALAAPARAADFPQRAVRLVVPYSVGIGPDVVARGVAEGLARRWGRPVWVDNKPGASGIVAFGDVRRTAPDGHTLYLADTATLAVNPLLHASLPYDPQRDLLPLTLLFRATFLLWVGGGSRFGSLAALLAAARRAPGAVSYASLGNGHASHVAVETFARAAGVQLLHVPFKDSGTLLASVVSAEVDFTTVSLNTAAALMAGGRLRPLAVAARRRLPGHPEIPTLPDAGGPAVEMHPWAALVGVAGTPQPVVDRLQHDLAVVLDSTELRGRAEQAGFELTPSTPQALRERMQADRALVAPLVAEGRVARL
ncbi:tripartite tricarboxylate transporter substrate binding protein [Ideonella sp. A 288]|uniref:Bug family tripartite tricarboxylate transporter substrate binding protein n=1 Tax=Ideonella sp. A 288 TaxID=1962181 RepID=UPI000B4C114E|nr:tripartite tricarboxylate transporter substrate binding protein [Ideonella sp. A 288]